MEMRIQTTTGLIAMCLFMSLTAVVTLEAR